MDEDALLAWFGGKSFAKLGRRKHKKIQERADDDNGNDDKSSADYIPMENVSRQVIKVRNQEEKKRTDKLIRDQFNKKDAPPEAMMDEPVADFEEQKAKYEKVKSNKALREKFEKEDPDYKPSLAEMRRQRVQAKRDAAGQPEAAMDEAVKQHGEFTEAKEHYEKLKRSAQYKKQLQEADPDYKPSAAEMKRKLEQEAIEKLRGKSADKTAPVGARNTGTGSSQTPNTTKSVLDQYGMPPKPPEPIAPSMTLDNSLSTPGDNAQQENPLAPTTAPTPDLAQQAARVPSLVGQLPPTETTPIAPEIPGSNGELAGVQADDPKDSKSLPLQLDVPSGTDEQPAVPTNPVLSDLSAEYQRSVSKPISLLGQPIDPASNAYDVADRAIAPMQLMNEGLLKTPTGFARLANFINYPLDKLAGTDAFGKNNKMLDRADSFIDALEVTRKPTNAAERAMTAVGMLAMPFPGVSIAQALGPTSVAAGIGLNEGFHQIGEAVGKQLIKNPRVQNKYDELEPRVTTVGKEEAKQIQQKLDADARSFIPKFAEANYGDTLAYTAGAAAAMYGLYKGHQYLKSPVAGRTILNADKPIVENAPTSITTAGEALRTINQDANFVLENQARKFKDLDLVHDISAYTRAGLAARMESMIETGTVNTPGFEMQLSASPKQLVEMHLKRPEQEQQDVSRAFHILDQVDHAKLNSERRAAQKEGGETSQPSTIRAPTARSAREQIEDAFFEAGGDTNNQIPLDVIRSKLPNLSRAEVDSVLSDILGGKDPNAVLAQNSDPKSITAAMKDAAYSPAGEPWHGIRIKAARPKEAEAEAVPKLSGKLAEDAPKADYVKMPAQPDIDWATALLAKDENAGTVRMMNEIRQAKAKVAETSGRWDAETTSSMLAKRPNYVHRVATEDYNIVNGEVVPKTRLQSMIDGLRTKRGNVDHLDVSSAELSSVLERERVNAPNQMVDAVLANVDDLQKTSVFAHENDIVKRFYNGLQTSEETAGAILPLAKGDKIPKGYEAVSFYDGGKQVRFAVEPLTARALKFAPTSAASRYNIASAVRNAFQAATTGPVLAPFFAGTSFTMEASIGAATRARSMRVGNIDAALQATTGGVVGAPGDMFGTMAAGVGAVRRAQRADNLLHSIQKTEDYLLKYGNRSLQDLEAQMPGTTKKIARGLTVGQDATLENILATNRELYEQTAKGWALKNGALHSSNNELMRNANKFYSSDILHSMQKQFGQEEGSGWYNWYKNLILNIHDAGRLAQVEGNLGRVGDKELAYQTRKFSGDLGVRGMGNMDSSYILSGDVSKAAQLATKALTSKGVGSILDAGYASIPYINPHIQGTTRFLEQLAKQPTSVIAGAMNSTTLPVLAGAGMAGAMLAAGKPEYLDYMLNKREEYKKTGYIYVPIPGLPPQDGLDFRIDPVLAPFGYPVLEALDSVFGLRKLVAQAQNRETPNAETQGIMSALGDGIKEAIGFGLPIQASLALATQGVSATRNIFDSSFAQRSEQASKVGTGKNPGSALSVPTQMMLENILGATAQHAIAGMDAYASSGKQDSALKNAFKGSATSFLSKMPGASAAEKIPVIGTLFAGKNFNESGSVLAANVRKFGDAQRKIAAAIGADQSILLKSQNAKMLGGNSAVDPVKMGNPGIVSMPPELQNNIDEIKQAVVNNGRLKGINGERSSISTSLTGLRGINAGNIGRHLLVPLKEGKEIGGLGYTILNEELLKKELAKEQDSIVNPKMTKGGKTRAPRESVNQRALALPHLTGGFPKIENNKVKSPEDRFYKPPTLKEVQQLKNALNERRYTLDLQAADEYEGVQKALGINLVDIAKKIKLTPEAENELASDVTP